ncbi:6-bladed beta-propeller [Algoriphagus formosus]|uniref:6-bladed beta-propeller n=1 Tax=Algoriphagus formosus TaxID=2007308 RepID=UPI000C284F35|nr:6-bladed beta-propeller [Algoriphagus formosus]
MRYLVILSLFIFSCTNLADEKGQGKAELIDFEKVEETDSLLSPRYLFSETEFLLLKTPDSLRLTVAGKIRELNKNILILDQKKNIVFVFDEKGEFISLVGSKGEGPSEFKEVTDFDVKGDKVYLFSRADFAIFKFNSDLVFEEKIKVDEWGLQMSVLNTGHYALYSLLVEGDDEFNINVIDNEGSILEKRMIFDRAGDFEGLDYSGFINGEFYTYPLSSYIYKINEGGKFDSLKYEINFPQKFPEEDIFNWTTFQENSLAKHNNNILTKFEFGLNGEFICYYGFREGTSNGYTLGIRLASGQKFGHKNLKHAAKDKFDDIYLQMFLKGPYNIPYYSKENGQFFVASNTQSVGIYFDYIVDIITSERVYDKDLLQILKSTDLEESIIMKFKLKERI